MVFNKFWVILSRFRSCSGFVVFGMVGILEDGFFRKVGFCDGCFWWVVL